MRLRRASVSYGVVNRRLRVSRQAVLLVVLAAIGLWMAGSIVHEVALNRSLSDQTGRLQAQNAALAASNDGYRRDIAAVKSGAAAEEEARKAGYAKSDEHIFVIATPPPPTSAPPRPRANASGSSKGPLQAFWHYLTSRFGT